LSKGNQTDDNGEVSDRVLLNEEHKMGLLNVRCRLGISI